MTEQSPSSERVEWAAIRFDDQIYTGITHFGAVERAAAETGLAYGDIAMRVRKEDLGGFLTSAGRFVDRSEAGRIADANNQHKDGIRLDGRKLLAGDILRFGKDLARLLHEKAELWKRILAD